MSEWDAKETARNMTRALADTGFMARNYLGLDYDQDEDTGKRVRGGIRNSGPHKEMTGLLDSSTKRKLLQAPRGSYKTSILMAYAIRLIARNRDERILWASATEEVSGQCVGAIRHQLEHNKKLTEDFGEFKGEAWTSYQFKVAGRSAGVINKDFTLVAVGEKTNFTGQHYTTIIFDDIVNWQNSATQNGIDKIHKLFVMVRPLLDPGGTIVVNGTRYMEEDLSGHIMRNMADEYDILVLDCGMYPVRDEKGQWQLEGTPRFKHLPPKFLLDCLRGMKGDRHVASIRDFNSQYNNIITGSDVDLFRRDQFHVMPHEPWMHGMRAYVVTDTATKQSEDGCFSVVGVVGLDRERVAYLFDLEIGYWLPTDFEGKCLDMYERWMSKLQLAGILMEKTTLSYVFQANIEREAKRRALTPRFIPTPRGRGEPNKIERISGLSARFNRNDFIVVDTVPMYYDEMGKRDVLFDPEGYKDSNGNVLPDGELVRQFVRFPAYNKRDIADALADIDMLDKERRYICTGGHKQPSRHAPWQRGGDIAYVTQMVRGRKVHVNLVPTEMRSKKKVGMWQRLAARIPEHRRGVI